MCPDREILSAYLDGEVESPWSREIEGHLAGCESCRLRFARMEETRRILQREGMGNWRAPMERVRRHLMARSMQRQPDPPIWKRRLSIPVPLVGIAALVVLCLGISLAYTVFRNEMGTVRITKAPAGGTEIQIAAPVEDLEFLLKSMDTQDSAQDVIKLPKKFRLMPVGEPRMGKADEFLGKKTW
jgi:anti-sigma factor RsiW